MNKIFAITFLGLSPMFFSQIKEEKLILNKKREPEVKRIEKIKTSVPNEKNYPPKEKKIEDSLNLKYDIVNVPAVSDFQTSKIQGTDISPKLQNDYPNNYFRLGYGNYGKFLADGNISKTLENKIEVGADIHYLSTNGLKKLYTWDSNQSTANLAVYGKHYGEKGKASLQAEYIRNDYNFYGIYNPLEVQTSLKQNTNQFSLNGYYDFYSNEILNDFRVKTYFLNDKFQSKENKIELHGNLSKHNIDLQKDFVLNTDLNLGISLQNTNFSELEKHRANFFQLNAEPKLTLFKGKSYLSIGSGFTFLHTKKQNNSLIENQKYNKMYWFPKAELLLDVKKEFKFYTGVDGGLQMNSYAGLLQENPYLSPDQNLIPTETKYKIYFGVKGDINEQLKYDISAGFAKMRNIMFLQGNNFIQENPTKGYQYANTFSALYDNGKQSFIKGSVQYFPISSLILDGELSFQKYQLDNHKNIYNIPLVKAEIGAKYIMLNDKLHLGGKAFFVTDRTTNSHSLNTTFPFISTQENTNTKVGGYADINFSAEYKIHKNFSIFALANNLLNANYQVYHGYKVLGAQILGGLKISF